MDPKTKFWTPVKFQMTADPIHLSHTGIRKPAKRFFCDFPVFLCDFQDARLWTWPGALQVFSLLSHITTLLGSTSCTAYYIHERVSSLRRFLDISICPGLPLIHVAGVLPSLLLTPPPPPPSSQPHSTEHEIILLPVFFKLITQSSPLNYSSSSSFFSATHFFRNYL